MAAVATNAIAGPANVFVATFGATEPASSSISSAFSASGWTDVGGTLDGVTITAENEWFTLAMDQVVDVVGRTQISRNIQVATNLAEPTLANLSYALNGGTVTASASYSVFDPQTLTAGVAPTYKAVLMEGLSPGGFRRWIIFRRCLSIESVEVPYKKDEQTVYPVTWGAHYVSSSIAPFRVIDQTA